MKAPLKIYLQIGDEHDDGAVTWCQDRINDDDIEYILSTFAAVTVNEGLDQLTQALETSRELKIKLNRALDRIAELERGQ